MIRTLMIEGFPVCFGEGEKPSWYDGDKIDALGTFENRPVITQVLNNTLGGVAETSDATFELVDSERGAFNNNRSLASIFRFLGENNLRIDGPDPLLSNETVIEAERTTHGTRKKMALSGLNAQRTTRPGTTWDFPDSYTFEWWWEQTAPGATAYFYRKVSQILFAKYNSASNPNTIWTIHGGVNRFHNNNSIAALGWHHIGVTYNADTLDFTIYVDGVAKSFAGVAPEVSATDAFYLWGREISTGPIDGSIGRLRIWKRALSSAEWQDAYDGKPVDDTSIFFNSKWMEPWGDLAWDTSGNQQHLRQAIGSTWEPRDYLRGDVLYLPNDTVRVQSIDASAKEITVERQVYSCLEDGYSAYYAALPYNTVAGQPYTCYAQEDWPSQYPGRLVAYYEGGHTPQHLRYLGFMKTPNQLGKSWSFETTHILKPLRDGFAPIQTNMPLKTNGAANAWWVGNPGFNATDETGSVEQQLSVEGLISRPEMDSYFQTLGGSRWYFSVSTGFICMQATAPTATKNQASTGLWDVCLEGDQFIPSGSNHFYSTTKGIDEYGLIFGNDSGESHMTLELDVDRPWNLKGSWLTVESQVGTKYFLKVRDVDYITGEMEIEGPYDEELNYLPKQTFGVMASVPLSLQTAQIAEATTLPRLIHQLLTSTGTGTNGNHDTLPGWMGLGLPSEIVDTSILTLSQNWPIRCNLSDADITDDLKFMGVALVWDYDLGKFSLKKFRPPAVGLAKDNIENDDLGRDTRVNVSWGQVAPVSSFKFKTDNGELVATVQLPSMWPGAQLNEISLESQTGCRIENADLMIADVVERLRWLSNYAPTVTMELPGHKRQIGDQLLLSISNIAGQGQGRYTVDRIPCIVSGMGKGPNTDWIQLQLNTRDTTGIAAWVPSWEIASYSGATVTLKKGGGLLIEDVFTLPLTVQIIDSLGAVLDATRTILRVTDDDTLVLSAAPTYTPGTSIGIIALPDYTTASSTGQAKYTWAANTSGAMSNADDGKVLS